MYDWGQLIFHPQFDTLSPSCKSRTSLGTMGSGATELLGLLKGGSPFIWGHYNSTKACGCLHTEWGEDEWAALTLLTCTDKSAGSAKGKACHVWSPWTNWGEYRHKIKNSPINTLNQWVQPTGLCFHHHSSMKRSETPYDRENCQVFHAVWKGLITSVETAPRQCPGSTLMTFKTSLNF